MYACQLPDSCEVSGIQVQDGSGWIARDYKTRRLIWGDDAHRWASDRWE